MPRVLLTGLMMLLSAFAFAQEGRLRVVATIHPWYDLVRQVGGELIDVSRLLPSGVSPHHFDPSARDVIRVAQADLIIMNGGVGLDGWVMPLITAGGTQAELLSIIDEINFEPLGSAHLHDHAHDDHAHDDHAHHDHDHEDHDGDHDPSADGAFVNAHIWLDVTIAMEAVTVIADTLAVLDPENSDAYRLNAAELIASLEELDAELLAKLEPVRDAAFVPFHDAWPYFARRYGLDLKLELEPVPGREPSPDYLIRALRMIEESGARAIFAERQLPQRPAQVVASEAGLPLFVLDPEGGGAEGHESYQELLRFNASVLLEALAD